MIVFLDTEFTDLRHPELLSIGLITLDGRENYVELDLGTDIGQARHKASSDFVRFDGVLDMWGRVPGATATAWEMGRRTGEWLLQLAEEAGTRVEIAFDYPVDFELMEHAIRDSGLWVRVREIVIPVNVGPLTGSPEGEIAAEQCFRELSRRGLRRHHALADAGALRAAYIAVKAVALQMARKDPPAHSLIDPTFEPTDEQLQSMAERAWATAAHSSSEARRKVSIKQLSFPTAEWSWAVEALVAGVLEVVTPTGELHPNKTSLDLVNLRKFAERVRQLEADDE